ncbi:hypothetical protein [Rheinheimera nanhaiensis]|uniref:Uncharacterized protein n=1 Tax=Rheinheimera nanhaiensis E407-8 TaxID=562729 RepID=I1DW70_9GAMM|nr:hypothetical protein [Rheinheimera nanhaiensis]GAB58298.1 hypothetical protein RNAN_1269 [Rheinheimera nanhaiensis E407-8]
MSPLAYSISIYRLLGLPEIKQDHTFLARRITLTKDLVNAVCGLWSCHSSGFSAEVVIGTQRFNGSSDCAHALKQKVGEQASLVKVELSRISDGQFYLNIGDLASRAKTLNKGKLPEQFFLVDVDYFYPIDKQYKNEPLIENLENICLFINNIKQICHYHDVTPIGSSRAILVISDEDNRSLSPKSIELNFSEELLQLERAPDLTLLSELTSSDVSPHKEEKLSTLRIAIWEFLTFAKDGDSTIYYLALNWSDILERYRANYEIYIRGFSFNKFSNEVGEYIHNAIKSANDLVSDVVVKTLSVPSLFALWLFVLRSPNFDWSFSLGLCIVVLFGTVVVSFQIESQLYLIGQVKFRTLNSLLRFHRRLRLSNEPTTEKSEIADLIDGFSSDFDKRLRLITNRLLFMRGAIWFFLIVAVVGTVESGWVYGFSSMPVYFVLFIWVTLIFLILKLTNKKNISTVIYRTPSESEKRFD